MVSTEDERKKQRYVKGDEVIIVKVKYLNRTCVSEKKADSSE
ncbi:hypothetical protein OIU78_025960 [Salix suchowensis]|nr:hypothetical protein OIU78_025960 [Salix suchowensis]